MLVVAVDERRLGDRALPPGDAAHSDRADASDDRDLGVAERVADLVAEVRVDDLGVLVDQHERLELVELRGLLEQRVVAAEDRADRREREQLRAGLGGAPDARLRAATVDVGTGDGGAEGDHRERRRV